MNEGAGDPAPFSEQLFQLNYQLCKEFPAFTPLEIDCEKYHKVIMLYANVRKLQLRENKESQKTNSNIIRRPAGDNWF